MKHDYSEIAKMSVEEILDTYKTKKEGLSYKTAASRLAEYGENVATDTKKKTPIHFLIEGFKDKFVLILLLLAVIDYFTNDIIGSLIIIGITIISVLIRFVQDYSTYRFNLKLKEKLKIYTDVIRAEKQKEMIEKTKALGLSVATGEGYTVEYNAAHVDKGSGLAVLCRHLSIKPSETIAVGDSGNDLPVFRMAGLSVAMGNANQSIREKADVVVADNNHDGCAEAIEKYLL